MSKKSTPINLSSILDSSVMYKISTQDFGDETEDVESANIKEVETLINCILNNNITKEVESIHIIDNKGQIIFEATYEKKMFNNHVHINTYGPLKGLFEENTMDNTDKPSIFNRISGFFKRTWESIKSLFTKGRWDLGWVKEAFNPYLLTFQWGGFFWVMIFVVTQGMTMTWWGGILLGLYVIGYFTLLFFLFNLIIFGLIKLFQVLTEDTDLLPANSQIA